jgi:UDP-N-acetyl-D-glucosamine dehydrogenase
LPLAVSFAEAGFNVVGIDTQQDKLDAICRCESYVGDVDDDRLEAVVSDARLRVSGPSTAGKVDVAVICVPTPITKDKKPDLSYIVNAIWGIKYRLTDSESMVVLESSTYPGTTRETVIQILNNMVTYIAYSPERIDPGSKKFNIRNTPKLVGGIDKESTELATLLYSQIVDKVVPVSSAEVAETAKLYENVFRNVNIALANEMALICEKIGVSVWEVIDAAATKPFGFMPFYPGVGVGGHCIGVDDYYLIDKSVACGHQPRLDKDALAINEGTPQRVAYRIRQVVPVPLNKSKILILGVAFKRDVSDVRESPSVELMNILSSWGADVLYNDPYVPRLSDRMVSEEMDDKLLESVDCVVIATDHSCYDWRWIVDKAKLVFDTRNATGGIVNEKICRLGEKR